MSAKTRREAAAARAARVQAGEAIGMPNARSVPFKATELRAQLVEHNGKQRYRVDGYASIVERAYEMWDFFGPFDEVIDRGAFDKTLAADPDVAFLVNHRGVTMARTTNGTLELSADSLGLRSVAWLNPDRQDVRDLIVAIDDRDIDEMSFAFMIENAEWNDEFTEFRISEVDINRGDVSAVNYGANPYTSIAARSREIMRELDELPEGAIDAAMARLARRAPRALDAPDDVEAVAATRELLGLLSVRSLSADDAARLGTVLRWLDHQATVTRVRLSRGETVVAPATVADVATRTETPDPASQARSADAPADGGEVAFYEALFAAEGDEAA